MNTLETVFLIITAVSISLFFIILTGFAIYSWVALHKLIKKAEMAAQTVEDAGKLLTKAGSSASIKTVFGLIKYLFKKRKEKDEKA